MFFYFVLIYLKKMCIRDRLGVEKSEVDKILKKLKAEEKIISPKRCYYSVEK